MDQRLGGHKARRVARGVWRPALALAVTTTVTPALLIEAAHVRVGPRAAAGAGVLVALAAAGVASWFIRALTRALVQPRRDREAADALVQLRDDAARPGRVLLEITHTQWISAAGQRAWAINVATGAVVDCWIPARSFAVGSFVLMRQVGNQPPEPFGWMSPDTITAASRHLQQVEQRRSIRAVKERRRQARRAQSAGRAVVREAERITRAGTL